MHSQWGKYIMVAGAILLLIGAAIHFAGDKLRWVGHLPGDIHIERENFRFYFPITTMIIFSVFVTIILYIARKFFQ